MKKQREPSFGLLLGISFVIFLNSVVIVISVLMLGFMSFMHVPGRFEAIMFIVASILNLIAVSVVGKGKFLTIVRRTAIAGNAMFVLLAFQAIMSDTSIHVTTITIALVCLAIGAANIAGIIIAPTVRYQQDKICPECGYDLRGLRTRGCPECGWERKT